MADLELARHLRGLADFLPIFERPGFTFGTWVNSVERTPGVWTMPYVEFGPEASASHEAAATHGWVRPTIDWMAWGLTAEAKAFEHDIDLVSQATPDQLAPAHAPHPRRPVQRGTPPRRLRVGTADGDRPPCRAPRRAAGNVISHCLIARHDAYCTALIRILVRDMH